MGRRKEATELMPDTSLPFAFTTIAAPELCPLNCYPPAGLLKHHLRLALPCSQSHNAILTAQDGEQQGLQTDSVALLKPEVTEPCKPCHHMYLAGPILEEVLLRRGSFYALRTHKKASHMGTSSQTSSVLLPNQLPGKAAEEGSSTWASVIHMGNPQRVYTKGNPHKNYGLGGGTMVHPCRSTDYYKCTSQWCWCWQRLCMCEGKDDVGNPCVFPSF